MPRRTTNQGVCQAFSRREQDVTSHSGNLYIHCGVLYSYGDHFPIAKWATDKIVLFVHESEWSYSVSTSQHCWEAWREIRNPRLKVYFVDNPLAVTYEEHSENCKGEVDRLRELGQRWQRGRSKKQFYYESIEERSETLTSYRHTFMGTEYSVHPCLAALRCDSMYVPTPKPKESSDDHRKES